MWIATTAGFFSIVEKPWDKEKGTVTVRARVHEDLENFKRTYTNIFPHSDSSDMAIIEDVKADYRFRLQAKRDDVITVVRQLILEVDYDNFKNAVATEQGVFRSRLYGKVWAVLLELQTRVFKGRDHER